MNLSSGGAAIGKGGRKLSYIAKVQGNGNLLIGKAYTAMLNLEPGDEFEIKLGKKAIRLIPRVQLRSTWLPTRLTVIN